MATDQRLTVVAPWLEGVRLLSRLHDGLGGNHVVVAVCGSESLDAVGAE
jgi:hypothetical protein